MMMKKQYIIPTAQVVRLEHTPLLYEVSNPTQEAPDNVGGDIPKP
jgi:hypothetical protein